MRGIILKSAAGLIAGLLATSAPAVVSVTSTNYGLNDIPAGAAVVFNFDDALPAGYTLTGSNFTIQSGDNGVGAAPANGPTDADDDATKYLTVFGGAATLSGSQLFKQVSLYWGSIDTYNSLQLLLGDMVVGEVTSTEIGSGGNGDQLATNTNRRVNISSTVAFNGVRFTSTGTAMEVDNVALAGAVPEAATWAMMVAGFGALGAAMRRRRASLTFA